MNHMKKPSYNQDGNITLTVVFLTSMAMLILAFGDHTRVFQAAVAARAGKTTEQAFYAAQSCVEEGYLQLRTDATYHGGSFAVGDATCTATVTPNSPGSTDGTLTGAGTSGTTLRGIMSGYSGAGPETVHHKTQIFHVIDRSGSMADDHVGCSDYSGKNQIDCLAAGLLWGDRPFVSIQKAAIDFNSNFMNSSYDQIGLVTFSSDVFPVNGQSYQPLTDNELVINHALQAIAPPDGTTHIASAITFAKDHFPAANGSNQYEILLTDGVPNDGCLTGFQCTIDATSQAKSQGIHIITIGFGNVFVEGNAHYNPNSKPLLETLASKDPTTGQPLSFIAPDNTALQQIYQHIEDIITTYNLHQGSWNEQ